MILLIASSVAVISSGEPPARPSAIATIASVPAVISAGIKSPRPCASVVAILTAELAMLGRYDVIPLLNWPITSVASFVSSGSLESAPFRNSSRSRVPVCRILGTILMIPETNEAPISAAPSPIAPALFLIPVRKLVVSATAMVTTFGPYCDILTIPSAITDPISPTNPEKPPETRASDSL